ncbi:hypothetical protein ACT18_17695 [Mycolicibacter kumamotonensis]|uniref:Bacteriophage protein n=1 Tax=Mycolicibacter kumamotonensis TaxID=354243 RepID=A0A1B8SCL6_9MYCO|nr:hypothetical protein ACT18_17695 [Mycolicibacter kumamotonensis]
MFGGTAPTGGDQGIRTSGDVLVDRTADGTDLNAVWDEFRDVLAFWNNERTSIVDLLAFRTTDTAEAVPQTFTVGSMERATELGVPQAGGFPGDFLLVGYRFDDYDRASRLGWRFLRDSDVRQVRSVMDNIMAADNKLTTGLILQRLLNPVRGHNEFGATVFGLYDGAAPGPPPYLGRNFPDTENHYIASGASQIDSGDIEDAIRKITRKGFGTQANSQILILANPDESELIQSWRAGEQSRPAEGAETSGPVARYDFIPAKNAPPFLTPASELIGEQVPGEYNGLKVEGSYGPAMLIQSDFVPPEYVIVTASYGKNSPYNPVAFREHPNAAYQGLRLIPGSWLGYPIIESFAARGCGVGTRHRGGAVAVQVTTDAAYTAPVIDL